MDQIKKRAWYILFSGHLIEKKLQGLHAPIFERKKVEITISEDSIKEEGNKINKWDIFRVIKIKSVALFASLLFYSANHIKTKFWMERNLTHYILGEQIKKRCAIPFYFFRIFQFNLGPSRYNILDTRMQGMIMFLFIYV